MSGRGVWVHVALLGVASAASLYVVTRDASATSASAGETTLWNGRPDDVQRIVYDANGRKVTLEAQVDAQGRFFLGSADVQPPGPAVDGGSPSEPHAHGQVEPKGGTLVSVTAGQRVARAVAPLKASHEIGRIDGARAAEFGFKDPPGTLSVTIAGQEHRITLGGPTPGGVDRYVRDERSGQIYSVRADFLRDLESAEVSLLERDLHEFQDPDIESVRILAAGKSLQVLRTGPSSKRIWAEPGSPDQSDETVSNWIGKVDRLRPGEYPANQPTHPEILVRLEYKAKGAQGAFLEVAKVPVAAAPGTPAPVNPPGKADYLVRSERTRLWAKVNGPIAEQVEQDLPSVVR